jgi:hypothetical protein
MSDPTQTAGHTAARTPCANCATPGSGRFCSECGQRRDIRLHSVGHFLADATEVITHADSTLWRTLLPLMTRPGLLVREFIAGRRARTLQPFRLYLITSVAFFLVGSWTGTGPGTFMADAAPATPPAAAAVPANAPTGAASGAPSQAVSVQTSRMSCDVNDLQGTAFAWLAPRLHASCESINADSGREFGRSVFHNLGRAMFVFVPLLAAVMKLLYWRPKRYYLEHLLLLLYNHAAVFIAVTLYGLLALLVVNPGLQGFMRFVLFMYLAWYVFRSMRVNYGQGRALTAVKLVVLAFAYALAAMLMLGVTAAWSALTL